MVYIFLFILGLSIGSFLNVLIDRLPRGESIVKKRSYCESCKKNLHWHDLAPVVSFIFLKGHCRYCRSPISFYYPIVEVITGILFVLIAFNFSREAGSSSAGQFFPLRQGFGGQAIFTSAFISQLSSFIFQLFIISSLIVVFFTDLKYGIIPDKIIYSAIAVSFFFLLFTSVFINKLFSALASFVFFLAIFLITRGKGMGFGDVKLSFLMGLILGFPKVVVALYIAFLTGAGLAIILILWGKKKFFGDTIPFGPFLVLGTIVSIFYGEQIFRFVILYLGSFQQGLP